MKPFLFLILTLIVFFIMLIVVMPKILYFATLIYHALFKRKDKGGKKGPYLTLKDLKEIKSEKLR